MDADVLAMRAPAEGADRSSLANLSRRERQVLQLMAQGLSNRGIAEHLGIATKTVESHVRNIFVKLGLSQRATHERRVLAVIRYIAG